MQKSLTFQQIDRLHFPLVKKFYPAYYPSGKANKADPIWALTEEHSVRVCLRLKQLQGCQLLTAMVTHPDYRQQGLGHSLLIQLIKAPSQPLLTSTCYCFAFEHLEGFYHKVGFVHISENSLPPELKSRFLAYTQSGKKLIPMKFTQP